MGKIIEVRFEHSRTMCIALQRLCHFYEVPGWIGKDIKWDEMDQFYIKNHGDKYWWANRYAGANLPDFVFKAFENNDDLTGAEKKIMKIVSKEKGPYYVAATAENCLMVRDHELAHAMWYLDEEYRDKATKIVDKYWDKCSILVSHLSQHYDGAVLKDEVHAYVGVYTMYLNGAFVPYPMDMHRELKDLFDEYIVNYEPRFVKYGKK